MANVKQLAGQTMWYGISSVGAKFLNYLLTPLLTYLLNDSKGQIQFGEISLIYAWFGVMNVIFTYGIETAYFRYCVIEKEKKKSIFDTSFGSVLFSSVFFALVLYLFRSNIADFLELKAHVDYINICILILLFDTLQAIPFAKLRQENRPRKYAFIKIFGIVVNIAATVFFIVFVPRLAQQNPGGVFSYLDTHFTKVTFVLWANLLQSLFVFFALFSEWRIFRFKMDAAMWKKLISYGSPMIIIGLAGMVNEVLDRQMLMKWYSGTASEAKTIVGIYSANYKISIVITMFIQAFRMAAEPFFFNQSEEKNAPQLYAKVMNWFVITVCLAFLFTALYLDVWKYFVGAKYRSGLYIVPILLMANIFSGIYYNLSIWYKLTAKMRIGMYITLFGALITIVLNYLFIPKYGMLAAAWTTCICYFSMMILCYFTGQRYFKVPYNVKKVLRYLALILILFFCQQLMVNYSIAHDLPVVLRLISGSLLLILFLLFVVKWERKELSTMPLIGKYLNKRL